jgi:hypothetical protein
LVTEKGHFAEKIGRNKRNFEKVAYDSRWKRSDRPAPSTEGDSQSTKEGYPKIPETGHGNVVRIKGCKGSFRERHWEASLGEGEPKRQKIPREQRPRPELNLQVRRGARLTEVGSSRWSANNRPHGLLEKRQSGRDLGNRNLDHRVGEKLRREKPRSVGS